MRAFCVLGAALGTVALIAGCSNGGSASAVPSSVTQSRSMRAPLGPTSIVHDSASMTVGLCRPSRDALHAACLASIEVMSASTKSAFPDSVYGLTPNDLSSIYGYPAPAQQSWGRGVIGIVVAYDNADAEKDLGVYRSYYKLPACTSANGCFTKVMGLSGALPDGSGTGSATSVSANPTSTTAGWNAESEADIEVASAVCPHCKIVLSEAASDGIDDLTEAIINAAKSGATIINASFGAPESSAQTAIAGDFVPFGVKVVAAAGDSGPGVLFPASSSNVIAVAGTTLNVSGTNVSESLWSSSGGGCSKTFQRAWFEPSLCSGRSVADVAAVADPHTGIAFYDAANGGWGIVGGTSIASPIIAGMYALSGDTARGFGAQTLYANSHAFAQVTGGGTSGGLGTPTSLSAF